MYQQIKDVVTGALAKVIKRLTNESYIPFDPANTDYQQFKIQVADGTPLEDPDGNVMTQAEVNAFLETLP